MVKLVTTGLAACILETTDAGRNGLLTEIEMPVVVGAS